jgi:hypothetical protein
LLVVLFAGLLALFALACGAASPSITLTGSSAIADSGGGSVKKTV